MGASPIFLRVQLTDPHLQGDMHARFQRFQSRQSYDTKWAQKVGKARIIIGVWGLGLPINHKDLGFS